MLRRVLIAGLLAAATVPVTATPASAICVVYLHTSTIIEGGPDIGPMNCNFCPLVADRLEKWVYVNCWT